MPGRRVYLMALALGLLVSTGLWSGAGATDRIVGTESPNGGAYLIKQFHVPRGAAIRGVRFVNNDALTVFPRVILLQKPLKAIAGAKVLAEVTDVRPVSAHRVEIGFPPVAVDSPTEVYVAIAFPASDGVAGVGAGAGIGAKQLAADAPRNCYFASDRAGQFGVMDVDYELELVFVGVGKATAAERETEAPYAADARVRPNPFNPSVTIEFEVPRLAPVEISVHDIAGRLVKLVLSESRSQGVYETVWDGRDQEGRGVATGIYVARIQIGDNVIARKLVLAK